MKLCRIFYVTVLTQWYLSWFTFTYVINAFYRHATPTWLSTSIPHTFGLVPLSTRPPVKRFRQWVQFGVAVVTSNWSHASENHHHKGPRRSLPAAPSWTHPTAFFLLIPFSGQVLLFFIIREGKLVCILRLLSWNNRVKLDRKKRLLWGARRTDLRHVNAECPESSRKTAELKIFDQPGHQACRWDSSFFQLFAVLQVTTALPHWILVPPRIAGAHRMSYVLPRQTSLLVSYLLAWCSEKGGATIDKAKKAIRTIPSVHITPPWNLLLLRLLLRGHRSRSGGLSSVGHVGGHCAGGGEPNSCFFSLLRGSSTWSPIL